MNWAFDEENFGCGEGAYDHPPDPQPTAQMIRERNQLRRIANSTNHNLRKVITADIDNFEDFVEPDSAKTAAEWARLDKSK